MSKNKLEAYYGLPTEVKFCKKCVMSNQKPHGTKEFSISDKQKKETISFGQDGICDACKYAEDKKNIDWEKRELELQELCDKHRSKDGSFDVIVPGSGGKDSGYQAHILKTKYGMHPLTVTWAPNIYTDIGWQNLMNWITIGGFDNYLYNPNGEIYRLLTKLSFEKLYHPHQPFIIGHKLIGPRMALMYNVKLVFFGENMAEYGNKKKENFLSDHPPVYLTDHYNFDKLYLSGYSVSELIEKYKVSYTDLQHFLPISKKELESSEVEFKYLGYYLKWTPQEVYYYATENTGFQPYFKRVQGSYSKYKGVDDKLNWIYFYTYWIKFGFGKATQDASQEIRNKHITRDEGIALVHRYDGEFPSDYFDDFLDYIGVEEEEFWARTDKARSPHLWVFNKGDWSLRHIVS